MTYSEDFGCLSYSYYDKKVQPVNLRILPDAWNPTSMKEACQWLSQLI